jgi:hypothetical protein
LVAASAGVGPAGVVADVDGAAGVDDCDVEGAAGVVFAAEPPPLLLLQPVAARAIAPSRPVVAISLDDCMDFVVPRSWFVVHGGDEN